MHRSLLNSLILILLSFSWLGCLKTRDVDGDGKTILKYYTWACSPEEMVVIRKAIADFERANPTLQVQHLTSPGESYYDKLMTMMAGGNPPDVMYVQPERFSEYAGRSAFHEIQSYINHEQASLDLADYYPQSLEEFRWEGKLYGLPCDVSTIVLFYNKDLFDQAGLAYPDPGWDWQKLIQAASALTRRDARGRITQYGLIPFDYQSFIWQNGGEILSADSRLCRLDEPASVEALRFFVDLRNRYRVAPLYQDSQAGEEYFKTGRAAMHFNGRYFQIHISGLRQFRWDIAEPPRGKRRASLMIGLGWCMAHDTRHPAQAWQLLKYLSSRENLSEMARLGYTVPARRSVAESPVFLKPDSATHDRAYIDSMEYAVALPKSPVYAEASTVINEELELAFLGKKTVDKAAWTMKHKIDKLIATQE